MDPMRKVEDLVARGLDRSGDSRLGVGEGLGGARRRQRGHVLSCGKVAGRTAYRPALDPAGMSREPGRPEAPSAIG
jgi:hypothetical protein